MSDLAFSLSQQQIYFDQLAWPDSCHLNVGGTGNIKGNLDLQLYRDALASLVAHHEVLRMSITVNGKQVIHKGWQEPLLEFQDLSSELDPINSCAALCRKAFARTFQFGEGERPWQMLMMRIHHNHHIVMARFHHIIMDGYSVALAFRELGLEYQQLYEEERANGQEVEKGNLKIRDKASFADFVKSGEQYRNSKSWQKDAQWWQLQQLSDSCFSSANMFASTPRIESQTQIADLRQKLPDAWHHFYLVPRAQYSRYSLFSAEYNFTPYHLYGAALAAYLAGIMQQEEIVIGVPILNRSGKRFKQTLGMFAVLSPLKLTVKPEMSLLELMHHFAQKLKEVYRHAKFPLTEIMNQCSGNTGSEHLTDLPEGETDNRLFDVILSYELHDFSVNFGEANLKRIQRCFSPLARYPLTICICEFHQDEPIEIAIEASLAHFSKGDIQCLTQRLQFLLEQTIHKPETQVSNVSLVTPSEQQELTSFRHTTINQQPEKLTVLDHIYHQIATSGQNIALKTTSQELTYVQLWQQVEQAALRLTDFNIGAKDVVAVIAERSIDVIVMYLAVSRIGGIYVPMDVHLPILRLNAMLTDCNAKLIVYESENDNEIEMSDARVLTMNEWLESKNNSQSIARELPPWPVCSDPMYILFTSGSTGTPKGVIVPHGALATRITWLNRTFAISPADVTLQSIPLSFDPAQLEIYMPLTQGACCALAPAGNVSSDRLLSVIKQLNATTIIFVPTTLRYFLASLEQSDIKEASSISLRIAISGGEQLPGAVAQQFVERTGARLFNLYGPTEACIFASAYEYQVSDLHVNVPIGRPVDNTQLYVMDDFGRLLPDGVVGQLHIGGEGLANGYLKTEQTRKQFIKDAPLVGTTLYKTGDQVYWDHNKQLRYVSRSDNQLKLRGIRIEPSEIETALEELSFVSMAAVSHKDNQLVAWFIPKITDSNELQRLAEDNNQVWLANIIQHLNQKLPPHMIPAKIYVVNQLPKMTSGKIDHLQFEQHVLTQLQKNGEKQPPENEMQKWLFDTWTEVLKQPPEGVDTSFQQAGGDSLQALNLITRIEKHLGVSVPLVSFLQQNTIRKLSAQISVIQNPICQNLSGHIRGVRLYLAASGYGDAMRFQRLADALKYSAHVILLQPPAKEKLGKLKNIRELAELYCESIQADDYQGPSAISGFSVAGITATETANVCHERGLNIKCLILIDTTYPNWFVRNTPIWELAAKLVSFFRVQQLDVNQRTLGQLFADQGLMFQVKELRKFKEPVCQLPVTLIVSSAFRRWHHWFFSPWYRVFGNNLSEKQMEGYHGSLFDSKQVLELASIVKNVMSLEKGANPTTGKPNLTE